MFLSCLFPMPSEMGLAPPSVCPPNRVQDSRKVSLSSNLSKLFCLFLPLVLQPSDLGASAGLTLVCQCLSSTGVSKTGHRTPDSLTITENNERLTLPTCCLHFTLFYFFILPLLPFCSPGYSCPSLPQQHNSGFWSACFGTRCSSPILKNVFSASTTA